MEAALAVSSKPAIKVAALCGSLRKASFHRGLIRSATEICRERMEGMEMEYVEIEELPWLNTDLEQNATFPSVVQSFRQKISGADSVLFASPEYNYSISAPLKNAIDWGSRPPNVWARKAAAIVSAGGGFGGGIAQYHLREVGVFVDLQFVNKPEFFLQAFQWPHKFDGDGDLLDADAKDKLAEAISPVDARMNAHSLLASAAINIGLTLIVLFLFSVLKKQPSNAYIYYARRLSLDHRVSLDSSLSFRRFLPSFSWISRALRVPEDEMLNSCGLDALIIIRLFKFGIHFFGVCAVIGVVVLLPVNCNGNDGRDHSLSSFTISNISRGSNWLWVHLSCLWFISFYGLWLLYKEYKDILSKRIQLLKINRRRPDQFSVLVRGIPLCNEHQARGCSVDHFFSKHHPYTYYSSRILYDGRNLEELLSRERYISREIRERRERSSADHDLRQPLLEEKRRKTWNMIQKLQGEIVSAHKELPVAFVAFKCRWGATLAAQSQQSSHPLLWRTEMAPEPRDVSWRNLAIPHRLLPIYKLGVVLGATALTIFFAIPVTAVQGIAKFEKLKNWFPPAMAVQLIPGLSSIVTGYLPSVILNGFIYIVPFAMLAMAKLAGCVSKSKQEIKACNMVFYFLVGNVFFLSLISGSLLDEIEEYLTHPRSVPSHLARAVSSQADFFVTYILADGLSAFSLEILQPGLLSLYFVQSCIRCTRRNDKNTYLYSLPYFRVIPLVSLSVLIGMVYAVVSPLLLPFLVGYFCLGYVVYIHQIEDVYETVYETFGQYWPQVHHYIITAIVLMQITMIGLFGLKSKPAASISTIPLLVLTLMFNEYCKIRFLPSFRHYSVQDAMENDELDARKGELEINYDNASKAYYPPPLQSLDPIASGSRSEESRDFSS